MADIESAPRVLGFEHDTGVGRSCLIAVAGAGSDDVDKDVLEPAAERFDFQHAAIGRIHGIDERAQALVVGTAHNTNRVVGVNLAFAEFAHHHALSVGPGDDHFHFPAVLYASGIQIQHARNHAVGQNADAIAHRFHVRNDVRAHHDSLAL